MAKRAKAPAGPLATPLRPSKPPPQAPTLLQQFGDPASVETWKAQDQSWRAQVGIEMGVEAIHKLSLLVDHYGLNGQDDDRWLLLALKLANEYVPGFQVEQPQAPKGRPPKWSNVRRTVLYCSVMRENAQRELRGLASSDLDACRVLAKSELWKTWGTHKVLYNQFVLSRSVDLVRMVQRVHADPAFGNRIYDMWIDTMREPGPMTKLQK